MLLHLLQNCLVPTLPKIFKRQLMGRPTIFSGYEKFETHEDGKQYSSKDLWRKE